MEAELLDDPPRNGSASSMTTVRFSMSLSHHVHHVPQTRTILKFTKPSS